jgi:secreted PhoX family phosphatase
MDRRTLLKFIGVSPFILSSCNKFSFLEPKGFAFNDFNEVNFSFDNDDLILPEGFKYSIIRSWGDSLKAESDLKFGDNNDFVSFIELESSKNKALLFVNHEFINPSTIPEISDQKRNVGASVFMISKKGSNWVFEDEPTEQAIYNRRFDALTPVRFSGPLKDYFNEPKGTVANCSGTATPWGTILTCEENYHYYEDYYGWQDFNEEAFGYIVEINPLKPNSLPIKHSKLGRFAHENAALKVNEHNKVIVYMGDDKAGEHIYKFISENSFTVVSDLNELDLLANGDLYVAKFDKKPTHDNEFDTGSGKWIKVDLTQNILKSNFKDEADLFLNTRKAAKLLKATPLDRPESLAINHIDDSVLIALTQNIEEDNLYGSVLKISENGDYNFTYTNFLVGGKQNGFACPDNIVFDKEANLWLATDVAGAELSQDEYKFHGNNSLFMVPTQGKNAGIPFRFAVAPPGAELCGTCFSHDGKTMFLSVQHPGEDIEDPKVWPKGSTKTKSSVIAIYKA